MNAFARQLMTVPALILCLSACREPQAPVTVLDTQILPHPRILFTGHDEKRLDSLAGREPLLDSLRARLMERAESLLEVPVQEYRLQNSQLLAVSREETSRMVTLSLAFRLSGDRRFVRKIEEELLNVCNFKDWNPQHYLDVAEMTIAVAIAYDWLYGVLKPEIRQLAVQSIRTKALDEAFKAYDREHSWANGNNNWNVVCNAGMVIGALAIAEHFPREAERVIEYASRYIPNCLKHFSPDGVCYEGPAYWGYTNEFLSLVSKTLSDNFGGNDFGVTAVEGIDKTALYFIRTFSPSGRVFNFADAPWPSPGQILEYSESPLFFYYSKRFNLPEVEARHRRVLSEAVKRTDRFERYFFLSIPWYAHTDGGEREAVIPRLSVYEGGGTDVAVFSGDRQTDGFIWLAAKSGTPSLSHGHMDAGTFLVETDGIRWSDDPGSDYYHLPGFWNAGPGGQRWTYFRNTNFSHNTLSIDGGLQYPAGAARLLSFDGQAPQPCATIDLTPVYQHQATGVHREFRLLDDATVTVTDSIRLPAAGRVEWSMITSAEVACAGRQATLSRDGKEFYLKIVSPAHAVFTSSPARAFFDTEKPVNGFRFLKISVSGSREYRIQVMMGSKP
ncbi:MAG: heparinase II/III-family protein [Tannerella sp.]|jgi:hypothetical protein|nr:heparinase II/III-family protein [Tannerella sp.]